MITYDTNLFSNSDRVQNRLVELVRFVRIADVPNWQIGMHQHEDFCEWEYVEEGSGRYVIDSREYKIKAGDLICINRRVAHTESSNPLYPLRSWKICCRLSPMGEAEENTFLPRGVVPVIHTENLGEEICQCFRNLQNELSEKKPFYESMAIHLSERCYLLMIRAITEKGVQMPMRSLSLAMQVKQYIDLHYPEKITLDILAEELHASKFYIGHEMKAEYACSPIDYLIHVRLGEAQNLLNTTDLSIGEISRKVGYENISYFNNLFARKTGVTPSQFRSRNQRMYRE